MYTRCTHCETVFRVTPQQLQVSSGKVRCGRCHEVFDAFSSLSAQLPVATQPEVLVPPPPIERLELPQPTWRGATAPESSAAAQKTEPAPAPQRFEEDLSSQTTPDALPSATSEPARAVAATASYTAAEEPVLTLPDELFTKPMSSRVHWAWRAGCAALAVLALAQLTWAFATPLAHRVPALRGPLEAFCEGAGCTVALPHLPDQLFIESSDLQLLDAARPNEVLLTVTIRNRAPVAQALPLLELTLTGAASQVTSRRVFQPREYLEADIDGRAGIGANQEVSVRLYLSTGNLRAAGYRLYLFFA
jgi:predicted Zn finger-like uncharacterized protein